MIRAAAILMLAALPAVAQEAAAPASGPASDPAAMAEAAAERLADAAAGLSAAEGTGQRVAALTGTVRAYEDGLSALREAVRRAAARERALRADLADDEADLSRLLAVLMSVRGTPERVLIHPDGALPAIRAGIVAADVAPALRDRTAALRSDLDEIAALRRVQDDAVLRLEEGLAGVAEARTALAAAARDRADLPAPVATDEAAMQALVDAADTLQGFATTLAGDDAQGPADPPEARLPLPAPGPVARRFREPDASGLARPGWVLALPPRTLVTAPADATMRYAGPLLDDAAVAILELAPGRLLVLSGMGEVLAPRGATLAAGDPVGLMGGNDPSSRDVLAAATDGHGQLTSEPLYMELRQGDRPLDPEAWFEPGIEDGEP